MPNRPSIPADIAREILIESGHRCAVCGAGCPLERAHIVPWHKTKEHAAADLICLCASCHERADLENWGEKTLRRYKKRPWVVRHNLTPERSPSQLIQVTIDIELSEFDERQERWFLHALAGFLQISPKAIRIQDKTEGSTRLTIELPDRCAKKILESNDLDELARYLSPLIVIQVQPAPADADDEEEAGLWEKFFGIGDRALEGAEVAFRLASRYHRPLLVHFMGHGIRQELAEEFVQETFLRFLAESRKSRSKPVASKAHLFRTADEIAYRAKQARRAKSPPPRKKTHRTQRRR